MAILKVDLAWKTYQDKQINALNDIKSYLGDSISLSRDIYNSTNNISDSIYTAVNLLINAIDAIWNSRDLDNVLEGFSNNLGDQLGDILEDSGDPGDSLDILGSLDEGDGGNSDIPELNDSILSLKDVIDKLELDKLLRNAIDSMDEWSDLYNQTIQMTGASADEAQAFRRDVVNVVRDLNSEVGNLYDPQEALKTMLAVSNSTDISNRETLQAITAPVLLAQETMNLSLDTIAKTTGRLYTRYQFTSGDLESLVSHIRDTTAGNDVSEDKLLQAMDKLEDRLAISVNGDKSSLDTLLKETADAVAYLEANYIDSSSYLEDLYAFLSPDVVDKTNMASKYSNYDTIQSLVDSGDFGKAMQTMLENIAGYNINVAKAYGIDPEVWDSATAATLLGNFATYEEFLANIDKSNDARESAEDKYVSIEQQIANNLKTITSYLATIQEDIGIGASDIKGIFGIAGNLGSILSTALIAQGLTASGTTGGLAGLLGGMSGSLGAMLPALGVGAAAVGLVALVAAIHKDIKKEEDESVQVYEGAYEEEAPYGYGYRGVWDSDKGKTEWSYSAFDTQEEADRYDEEAALEQYIQSRLDERNWLQKGLDLFTARENTKYSAFGIGDYEAGVSDTEMQIRKMAQMQEELLSNRYKEVATFYRSIGQLDEYDEVEKLYKNIHDYHKYYNQGMFLADNGKWYYIDSKELVPKNKTPDSFDVGTNYVTHDQLAYIHEGEAIIPEEYNPAAHMSELERLRSEENRVESERDETTQDIKDLLSDIKVFLEYWQKENARQESLNATKNAGANRINLLSYMTGV